MTFALDKIRWLIIEWDWGVRGRRGEWLLGKEKERKGKERKGKKRGDRRTKNFFFFFFFCIASTLAFYKYDSRSSYEPHVAFIDYNIIVIIS